MPHSLQLKSRTKRRNQYFYLEGDSATVRSPNRAMQPHKRCFYRLKGKPLNPLERLKKLVRENEEFNLLQVALNIEDGIENIRYRNIIVATDADSDGMHIRMLLLTFFLNFISRYYSQRHLFILQTPLFRVRNKKKTNYCYSDKSGNCCNKRTWSNPQFSILKV